MVKFGGETQESPKIGECIKLASSLGVAVTGSPPLLPKQRGVGE